MKPKGSKANNYLKRPNLQAKRDIINKNQIYAPYMYNQIYATYMYNHRVRNDYMYMSKVNRAREARIHRINIRRRQRLTGKKALPETESILDSYDDKDFVYYVATDSDSETEEVEFDNTYINPSNSERNRSRTLSFPMGEGSTGTAKPCMAYNGYFDNGDPVYICGKCKAYMWYGERLDKKRQAKAPKFGVCCRQGRVVLPRMKNPPRSLQALYYNGDERSKHYREFVRAYNMMFAFTSLGGKIDNSVNDGKGPYVFKLFGENYHMIGDMLPQPGEPPAFTQLYIYDTLNEVSNRMKAYGSVGNASKLRPEIVELLRNMLNAHNGHVKGFRTASEKFQSGDEIGGLVLKISSNRTTDGRIHHLPTGNEVAGLIPGDFVVGENTRDIVVEYRSGRKQRISELHPAYLTLQYPLLFPYGEDGFRLGIDIGFVDLTGRKRTNITMREFFAYRIQTRVGESPIIPMSGRLFQQFLVDSYTMIETNRLRYVWFNQKNLRCENYERIKKTCDQANGVLDDKGQRIMIPSSFTGGSRYMMQHYLDAMALCKYFGYPDIFITITCNPKWPEITRYLAKHSLKPEDRPDVMCRVFKMKLDNLVSQLTTDKLLGTVSSVLYTIEFQKRGLPHAHMVLFLDKDSKLPTTDDIDKFISAEIPDKDLYPYLYEVVSESMIHGPCGDANKTNVCMHNGKCTKFFPRPFSTCTKINDDGYPLYRRRDDGRFIEKLGFRCDNRYVVPYNKDLLIRYRAHINVEWCNQSRSIKYLFKYIHKGPDYIGASVQREDKDGIVHDEVAQYFSCRYISACEATWRILAFPTHYRTTSVVKLSFHAPNKQRVIFNPDDPIEDVLNRKSVNQSMFLAWMVANKKFPKEGKKVTYADFPSLFVWKGRERAWKLRERGFAVGRITHVPRSAGEDYYLRILLNIVKGPTSFDEIKTVDGILYKTFQDACFAYGLLDDDKEYIEAIKEASLWGSGNYLRKLFVVMLMSRSMSEPLKVWDASWLALSEDLVYRKRKELRDPGFTATEEELKNMGLIAIDDILRNSSYSLGDFTEMPCPEITINDCDQNRLIQDELRYDKAEQLGIFSDHFRKLTHEQKDIYDRVMDAVVNNRGGVFFVYGFGGTGKTFLWSILSAAIRSKGLIVLNNASSGIASLLLPGGRTAHSRFGIPLLPTESSTCSIRRDSNTADLIRQSRLIIWDEAPMMNKYCFESLDKSMRDVIRDERDRPFGGKVVVFGGDFRQILPVIIGAGREQTVLAALNSSYIWKTCKVLRLTRNMRLTQSLDPADAQQIEIFSTWILGVGDGKINEPNTGEVDIDIPEDLLITDVTNPIEAIIKTVYGEDYSKKKTPSFLRERAILSPTNKDVDMINDFMLSQMEGYEKSYLSSDSIDPAYDTDENNMVYSKEFLNSVVVSGLPRHNLKLKIGTPIMLLRNIDHKEGLCNGTRLQVTQLADHVIEAEVITSADPQKQQGKRVLIPRMFLSPPETKFPFRMRRRQFPVAVAFAMTINKSQGQTLTTVGLFLPRPVFAHGQLYVALSRVRSREGLKILILGEDGEPRKKTRNVVYKEVFQNIG